MDTLHDPQFCDLVGRLLFGKPGRMRLGMWIASLRGRPHTFTQAQFWEFCREAEWPEAGKYIRPDLNRFAALGMVRPRPDLSKGKRIKYWTKEESPLWGIFEATSDGVGLGGIHLPLAPMPRRVERTKRALVKIARDLHG